MLQRLRFLSVLMLLAGCQSIPLDANIQADELVASAGVMNYFADPNVDLAEASRNITCKRHKLVGSHLISKVCRTREEWAELARNTRDMQQDHRAFQPCNASAANGAYMRSDLYVALIPTPCGDTTNRGQ
jgi:hypothetical protein